MGLKAYTALMGSEGEPIVNITKRHGLLSFIVCLILSFAVMPSYAGSKTHHRSAQTHKSAHGHKWVHTSRRASRSHRHAARYKMRAHRHAVRHKLRAERRAARLHRRAAHRHHSARAHRMSRHAYRHKSHSRHSARRTHRSVVASHRAGRATDFSGIASIYGVGSGRTANGERSNVRGMTAAHKTLPFGTRVAVTNRKNGRSVVVRINDRGPFIRGRVIDLTPAAARAIGFSGLAPVSLSVLR